MKELAEKIFLAGIEGVLPDKMIRSQVKISDGILHIADLGFELSSLGNIYVIGAGKASATMAKGLEDILGENITDGYVVVKYGHSCKLHRIRLHEAGHPVPDENSIEATKNILNLAGKAKENDLVICLISGGASALLADFPSGSTLSDLRKMNELLLKSGADIKETNTVRKHLSMVKGGQLAKAIFPATCVSLILSDVVGDAIDVIASGPTSPDPSTFSEALPILDTYGLDGSCPKSLLLHLTEGVSGNIPETPKPQDPVFYKVYNRIIGSNATALTAAREKATALGLNTRIVSTEIAGDINTVAHFIWKTTYQILKEAQTARPACLLFGGEPTIHVTGTGTGGRNQHLALYIATQIMNLEGITFLSAGTDGNDGPTEVAGAVVDTSTVCRALSQGLNPKAYLDNHDSYPFFRQAGGHIVTGPTTTNVMDMIVVIIE
jgi:Putative glycerate kinase